MHPPTPPLTAFHLTSHSTNMHQMWIWEWSNDALSQLKKLMTMVLPNVQLRRFLITQTRITHAPTIFIEPIARIKHGISSNTNCDIESEFKRMFRLLGSVLLINFDDTENGIEQSRMLQISHYIQRRLHLSRIPSFDPSTLFSIERAPGQLPVVELFSVSHSPHFR
jgi:hypothetical protein